MKLVIGAQSTDSVRHVTLCAACVFEHQELDHRHILGYSK
jgi:hypothetical protein